MFHKMKETKTFQEAKLCPALSYWLSDLTPWWTRYWPYLTDKTLRLKDGKSLPRISQLVGCTTGTQIPFSLPLITIFASLYSSHRQPFLEYQKYHCVICLFKQQILSISCMSDSVRYRGFSDEQNLAVLKRLEMVKDRCSHHLAVFRSSGVRPEGRSKRRKRRGSSVYSSYKY